MEKYSGNEQTPFGLTERELDVLNYLMQGLTNREIADKITELYNEAGFEFIYYDGSEGTQPPYSFKKIRESRNGKLFSPLPLPGSQHLCLFGQSRKDLIPRPCESRSVYY